jgi:hypothetical protein
MIEASKNTAARYRLMFEDSYLDASYEDRYELSDADYTGFDDWCEEHGIGELSDEDLEFLADNEPDL